MDNNQVYVRSAVVSDKEHYLTNVITLLSLSHLGIIFASFRLIESLIRT